MFKLLSRDRPQVFDKVVTVSGDASLPGFGLSLSNLELLIDQTSVVFNVASTDILDQDLQKAVEINVQGPRILLGICKRMKRLQVIVCTLKLLLFLLLQAQIMIPVP